MSEQQQPPLSQRASNLQVILFMVVLSFFCALVLSILASALAEPIKTAQELDQSKQMMIAAGIFTHEGYFVVHDKEGKEIPAKVDPDGALVASKEIVKPSREEILKVYRERLKPYVVNDKGEIKTFKDAGINEDKYIADNQQSGYYMLPWKLIYEIYSDAKPDEKQNGEEKPVGYVIPVKGFGLWNFIYGYLAIQPDGDTIIGTTWYDQKETPGLGANIADEPWQSQFPGKKIFQPSPDGSTDFKSAPLGITVVKGKVSNVLGDSPKAESAVDGMAGATLTGNGVTSAYRDSLGPYRPFFIKIHDADKSGDKKTEANKNS